ncbi:MAG: heavy-metal-associated domain-containing protein [Eubacteriales bacterium]|jgi:copper chaperone
MGTAIVLAVLAVCAILAIRSYLRRLTVGCCGSGPVKTRRLRRWNPREYPYEMILQVEGMHCAHCAAKVVDALEELEGIHARADFKTGQVQVWMKDFRPPDEVRQAVTQAGYRVVSGQ